MCSVSRRLAALALVLMLLLLRAAGGGAAQEWPAELNCQWRGFQLDCGFRPLVPVSIRGIEWRVDDGKPSSSADWQSFDKSGATSAILWLVDISDPARHSTVMRQTAVLHQWLEALSADHSLGLAAFSDGAEILAPLGSDADVLNKALNNLAARGHSTAFYRSLLDGVNQLRAVAAQRKSLWVFSDALAEDTVYGHEDVMNAARAAGVMIVGLGFPERESQQTELQRLQRLAEESGGFFAVASVRGSLPAGTLSKILAVVDGGGRFRLDLPNLYGPHKITLRLLAAEGGSVERTLSIAGPAPPPDKTIENAERTESSGNTLSFWLWVGGGSLIILLAVVTMWRRRSQTVPDPPLLARLEAMNSAPGSEWAIRSRVARIGRAHDNELRLEADSVSAYHAELRQDRDGQFFIIDLGATNGVWVNDQQVSRQRLRDGDVLELGEVRLRFWQNR